MKLLALLTILLPCVCASAQTPSFASEHGLSITASFREEQVVSANESIELTLSRPLRNANERIAVMIRSTDVSSLFARDGLRMRYDAKLWPLPLGDSVVTAYLVTREDEWQEIAQFALRVGKNFEWQRQTLSQFNQEDWSFSNAGFYPTSTSSANASGSSASDPVSDPQSSSPDGPQPTKANKHKFKFTPALTLAMPSQPAQSTFPGPQPDRAKFIELNMQASIKNEATYGILSAQSSFDFAGSSFEKEALRFATEGTNAPKVDLSSYLIHLQTGKVKFDIGHFSYGTQRQLINSFSSRGLEITVPFLKRFDFSLAAMNGTQLVGYDNFFGLDKSTHQMLSGTLGVELNRKRPGGLRVEISGLNAYFQPISGANRGVVTDVERSRGVAVRLIANDKGGRFHFESGFTRSFFASPSDQSLSQGAKLVALPNLTRNAHYLETSYQILKEHPLSKRKKANLAFAFREENVAPLFRSLGASTQADKIQYEFSVNGSINEMILQVSHVNFHDNLSRIPSILRSLTGSTHVGFAAPLSALLDQTKPSPWLPRLGYSYDRVHQFGESIPLNGGFELDPSTVPNLVGTNETLSADWQVKKFTWGYSVNHSYQDNRQQGRERADQGVFVHTGRIGIAATTKLNLNFDVSAESSANKETSKIDRTYRVGPGVSWQLTRHLGLAANLANTVAGDAANTSQSRNTEFDASWTYRFEHGKEEFKKLAGQFFIRYANHYSHSIDRILSSNTLQTNQTLTANMSITFF